MDRAEYEKLEQESRELRAQIEVAALRKLKECVDRSLIDPTGLPAVIEIVSRAGR